MTAEARDELDGVILALQAAGVAPAEIEVDDGAVLVAGQTVATIED